MNTTTQTVATFENAEDGIKVFVTIGHLGYHMSIQDTDSGEFLPATLAHKDLNYIMDKAKKAAGLSPSSGAVSVAL